MPNFYEDGRSTPDLRDDFEECDPGVIAIGHGRLGLNTYSDNDDDDTDMDYKILHYRRNTCEFADDGPIPDPYKHRRQL